MIQCHYMKGMPLQLTTILHAHIYYYRLTAWNELINNIMHKWKNDYTLLSQIKKKLLKTVMYIPKHMQSKLAQLQHCKYFEW